MMMAAVLVLWRYWWQGRSPLSFDIVVLIIENLLECFVIAGSSLYKDCTLINALAGHLLGHA